MVSLYLDFSLASGNGFVTGCRQLAMISQLTAIRGAVEEALLAGLF